MLLVKLLNFRYHKRLFLPLYMKNFNHYNLFYKKDNRHEKIAYK